MAELPRAQSGGARARVLRAEERIAQATMKAAEEQLKRVGDEARPQVAMARCEGVVAP